MNELYVQVSKPTEFCVVLPERASQYPYNVAINTEISALYAFYKLFTMCENMIEVKYHILHDK